MTPWFFPKDGLFDLMENCSETIEHVGFVPHVFFVLFCLTSFHHEAEQLALSDLKLKPDQR